MSSDNKSRVPALRKDSVTGRWVIFSPARAKRPSDFKSKAPATTTNDECYSRNCPFCLGNESMCAPLIFRVPPDPDSDWKIRVIQNLYPALDRNLQNPNPGGGGGQDENGVLNGFGFHDVVIETPSHSVTLRDLMAHEVGEVLMAYKKRIDQLMEFDSIKYSRIMVRQQEHP